jgi:hypothetical protein
MQITVLRFDFVDNDFIHVLRIATGDHVDPIHAGVNVPVDAVDLLEPDALVTLKEITDHGQSLFDALDLLQPFDISRIEIGSCRSQLDGAGPHEDQLRADVGRASLEIVGHAAGKPREKHDQADSQSHARDADKRANRALADV